VLGEQLAERGREGQRICGSGTDDEGGACGVPPRFGFAGEKREIGRRQSVFADSAIAGVADDADHLIVSMLPVRKEFVEVFSYRIFILEKSFGEGLVDDSRAGSGVRGQKIAAVEKRDFHGVKPAGRDVKKIGERGGRSRAVDGNGIVVGPIVEEGAVGNGDALDARDRAELIGELEPRCGGDGMLRDRVQNQKAVGGEARRLMGETLEAGDEKARYK